MTEEPTPNRTPPAPYSKEAEEALIGAALLDRRALRVLAVDTRPEDFYVPAHRDLSSVLVELFETDSPVDLVTVWDALERRGRGEAIGGRPKLVELLSSAPSVGNAGRYAEIVHDKATLRRLLGAAGEIRELVNGGGDAHDAVLRAQGLVGGVASQNGSRTYSSLDVADLAELLEHGLEPEEPAFLRRVDGKALLYAGKMHVFQAEPSSGKTWLALVAAVEVLAAGGAVVYLDYEDAPAGILGRLLAAGAHPDWIRAGRFRYIRPAGAFGPSEKLELAAMLDETNPDLVVIDGIAEALTRDGLSEDKASDWVTWVEKFPRWLTRLGCSVVMLDHVKKDPDSRGRYARGTGAKLASLDGAAYEIKVTEAFSRQRAGKMKLIVQKDRPGGVGAIGETIAVAHLEPKADGERVLIRLEAHADTVADPFKPTRIMAIVSTELERLSTPVSATVLANMVPSHKPKLVRQAIARLIVEGYVAEIRQGRTTLLRLVRPYGEGPPPERIPPPELPLEDVEHVPDLELVPDHDPDDPYGDGIPEHY